MQSLPFVGYKDLKYNIQTGASHVNDCITIKHPAPYKNDFRATLLHGACLRDCMQSVRYLLDEGADINDNDNVYKITPLMLALQGKKFHIAQELIEKGADIHKPNNHNSTPLHEACLKGHLETVRKLIKYGANINKPDECGSTPLHKACTFKRYNIVEELIESGADVNVTDIVQTTPLHNACSNITLYNACSSESFDIVEKLISHGAHVNTREASKYTPLHFACREGNITIITKLIASGADVNAVSAHDTTPLSTACKHGHLDAVRKLIQSGAHIDKQESDGHTPLYWACTSGQSHIVDELIKCGVDVNKSASNIFTPLYMAVEGNHFDTAKKLIEAGAYIDKALDDVPFLNNANRNLNTPLYVSAFRHDIYTLSKPSVAKDYKRIAQLLYLYGASTKYMHRESYIYKAFKNLDALCTKYPQGSVSYKTLCTRINDDYIDLYITKLCTKGLHKKAFHIITEKAEDEGHTGMNPCRSYLINYVCTHIAPLLSLTPQNMKTFVRDLSTYDKTNRSNDLLLVSAVIEHMEHIYNDVFIQECIRSNKEYINTTNMNEDSCIHNVDVRPNQGTSLLEKAIRLNKEDIVKDIIKQEHTNINTMYDFFDRCRNKHMSSQDITRKTRIARPKQYAHMIFDKHNHKRLLTGTYKPNKLFNMINNKPNNIKVDFITQDNPTDNKVRVNMGKKNPKRLYINSDIARYMTSYIDTDTE
jgi:ankyrin repeat protein